MLQQICADTTITQIIDDLVHFRKVKGDRVMEFLEHIFCCTYHFEMMLFNQGHILEAVARDINELATDEKKKYQDKLKAISKMFTKRHINIVAKEKQVQVLKCIALLLVEYNT